jgi:hypothetical protein
VRCYAEDRSADTRESVAAYKAAHPRFEVPDFVPRICLYGSRMGKAFQDMWSDKDGEKSAHGLAAFLLNHCRSLSDKEQRDIARRFGVKEHAPLSGGGSESDAEFAGGKMAAKRSPVKRSPARRKARASPQKRARAPSKWSQALAAAHKKLKSQRKISGAVRFCKSDPPGSPGRLWYDEALRMYRAM